MRVIRRATHQNPLVALPIGLAVSHGAVVELDRSDDGCHELLVLEEVDSDVLRLLVVVSETFRGGIAVHLPRAYGK